MPAERLPTKLTVPPERDCIARPRLREALSRGLEGKLILVSAPAGFGKSTLVADWIRSSGIAAAWISLDEGDNDPSRFLSSVARALEPLLPRASAAMRHLIVAPHPTDAEDVITALVNEISEERHLVVVLDGYHHISDPTLHAALGRLVELLPPRVHLLILTRADPPLPLARLRACGELTEIRAADLRFTREESARFFTRAHVRLSERDVEALAQRTEGWIAGMRLAVISLAGRTDAASFVAEFSGSNRYVLDYLSEEVMRGLGAEDQSFLVRTSLLDRLCGPLCDVLTGRTDSQAVLERMESANIFIESRDDRRSWYSYHPLFADLLRARLARLPGPEVADLNRRASAWFEAHAMSGEATHHALRAGDFSRAADLALAGADEALMHCESAAFLRWTDALPREERLRRPLLPVYRACAMLQVGRPASLIEESLAEAEPVEGAAAFSAEIAGVRSFLAFLEEKPREAITLARRSLSTLGPGSRFLVQTVGGVMGVLSQAAGDTEAARAVFTRSRNEAREAGNYFTSTIMQWRLAQLALMEGELGEAERLCVEGMPLATDEAGRVLPVISFLHLLRAEIHLERNELDEAEVCLKEARGPALAWTGVRTEETVLGTLRVTGLLAQARGDTKSALAAARQARELSRSLRGAEAEERLAESAVAEMHLADGNLNEVRAWAERGGMGTEPRHPSPKTRGGYNVVREAESLLYARLLLLEGNPADAASAAQSVLSDATSKGLRGLELVGCLTQSAAEESRGSRDLALPLVRRALRIAAPEGHVRPFLAAGAPPASLLRAARDGSGCEGFVDRLLAALCAPAASSDRPRASTPGGAALGGREIAIVRLMAVGLTNKEIAERVFVSEQTVKWHTGNIYGKLGVRNRTEAVARARGLGIIPPGG